MLALGRHLIVEYYDCNPQILDDLDFIEAAMLEATEKMKATRVAHKFHKFAPQGVSGAIIIEESHLTIHTWPEYGYAAVDFYSCGNAVNPHLGVEVLKNRLDSKNINVTELLRGFVNAPHKLSIEALEDSNSMVQTTEMIKSI